MTGFQSILLGILQGLTEFIPVSSTAHLLIAQKLLGIPGGNAMFSFLVIIQLGTLVSLVVFFWKDILHLIKAFFARPFSTPENKLGWYIIIATIPALLAGYLLKSFVEAIFNKPLLEAAIRLLITAVVLALAEGLGKRNRSLEKMNWLDSLIIGIAQVIAIFPGASRSGTTISAGMARGLDRPAAARFAFLMSIPVMLAAGGYQSLDLIKMSGIGAFLTTLVVGFVVAAVVGWFTVKWLLGYLSKHSLYLFALYCTVVGAVSLIIYLLFP
jgi:undecaprenyl-diphosphatase